MSKPHVRPAQASSKACLFNRGQLHCTPAAVAALKRHQVDPYELLRRHERGDYGILSPIELAANDAALMVGGRIVSRYELGNDPLYILTEADRRNTRMQLESEILRDCHEQAHEEIPAFQDRH